MPRKAQVVYGETLDFSHVNQKTVAAVFGVTPAAVIKWDCPRNDDKTYNLPELIAWRISIESGKLDASEEQLKKEKLDWEVKRLEAQVTKIKDEFIERSEVELLQTSRASSLRSYLEKSFMSNIGHFAHKSIDELRVAMYPFLQAMMKAYCGE